MSVPWNDIEKKPDGQYKVPGRYLLDQRQKVNDLENRLQAASAELNNVKTQLESANSRIADLEKDLADSKNNLETAAEKNPIYLIKSVNWKEQLIIFKMKRINSVHKLKVLARLKLNWKEI